MFYSSIQENLRLSHLNSSQYRKANKSLKASGFAVFSNYYEFVPCRILTDCPFCSQASFHTWFLSSHACYLTKNMSINIETVTDLLSLRFFSFKLDKLFFRFSLIRNFVEFNFNKFICDVICWKTHRLSYGNMFRRMNALLFLRNHGFQLFLCCEYRWLKLLKIIIILSITRISMQFR